jgi:hypothetical protein
MSSRNIARRLECLEAELAPPGDEPVLTIVVTCVGEPDQIIEVRGTEPTGRRRPWPPRANDAVDDCQDSLAADSESGESPTSSNAVLLQFVGLL